LFLAEERAQRCLATILVAVVGDGRLMERIMLLRTHSPDVLMQAVVRQDKPAVADLSAGNQRRFHASLKVLSQ
jgi:hypothetical protein